jgi:prevent-host-death family protein
MVRYWSQTVREVGILEAKTNLSSLLNDVEHGEEVIITRHGKRIARLIGNAPEAPQRRRSGEEIAGRFKALRDRLEKQWPEESAFDWKRAVEDGRE